MKGAPQLQVFQNETDCVDPFRYDFRAGYGMEMALITSVDDLCKEPGRGNVSMLVLLGLSEALSPPQIISKIIE